MLQPLTELMCFWLTHEDPYLAINFFFINKSIGKLRFIQGQIEVVLNEQVPPGLRILMQRRCVLLTIAAAGRELLIRREHT